MVLGAEIFGIHGGFQGLLDAKIEKFRWDSCSGFLPKGGTEIGTSRCLVYQKEASARCQAVLNLVKAGIDRLVIIGGDGSFQGPTQN